jgi:hypothetical protein
VNTGVATEPAFRRGALWEPATAACERRAARNIALGCVLLGGVAFLVVHQAAARFRDDDPTKAHAMWHVQQLANDRFLAWRAAHPDRACPDRLADLDVNVLDPWGRALHYTCDPRLLRAASPGIAITSAGEDGLFGTADDIGSDP